MPCGGAEKFLGLVLVANKTFFFVSHERQTPTRVLVLQRKM